MGGTARLGSVLLVAVSLASATLAQQPPAPPDHDKCVQLQCGGCVVPGSGCGWCNTTADGEAVEGRVCRAAPAAEAGCIIAAVPPVSMDLSLSFSAPADGTISAWTRPAELYSLRNETARLYASEWPCFLPTQHPYKITLSLYGALLIAAAPFAGAM